MARSLKAIASSAFSLVELSIVLVILGLLVGGVLSGQSLIRAAELRSVASEYARYVTAMSSFRDKYFAIPGDMTNAASFWGASATCPGVAATAAAGVCNGDGDGHIMYLASGTCGSTNCGNEVFEFWEDLAYGGLIEGSYTGNPNSATAFASDTVYGTNAPRSKMNQAGWNAYYIGTIDASSMSFFPGTYGNALMFSGGNLTMGAIPILRPEEAWNIDTKLDDGKPDRGNVRVWEAQGTSNPNGCTNQPPSASALTPSDYTLDTSSLNCALIFITGY